LVKNTRTVVKIKQYAFRIIRKLLCKAGRHYVIQIEYMQYSNEKDTDNKLSIIRNVYEF